MWNPFKKKEPQREGSKLLKELQQDAGKATMDSALLRQEIRSDVNELNRTIDQTRKETADQWHQMQEKQRSSSSSHTPEAQAILKQLQDEVGYTPSTTEQRHELVGAGAENKG